MHTAYILRFGIARPNPNTQVLALRKEGTMSGIFDIFLTGILFCFLLLIIVIEIEYMRVRSFQSQWRWLTDDILHIFREDPEAAFTARRIYSKLMTEGRIGYGVLLKDVKRGIRCLQIQGQIEKCAMYGRGESIPMFRIAGRVREKEKEA